MELKPNMTSAEKAAYFEELDRLEVEVGCNAGSSQHVKEALQRKQEQAQKKQR